MLVVVSTWLITTWVKIAVGRGRPEWQDTVGLVDSRSYPSGHTSSNAALMIVLGVLVGHAGTALAGPAPGVRAASRSRC